MHTAIRMHMCTFMGKFKYFVKCMHTVLAIVSYVVVIYEFACCYIMLVFCADMMHIAMQSAHLLTALLEYINLFSGFLWYSSHPSLQNNTCNALCLEKFRR